MINNKETIDKIVKIQITKISRKLLILSQVHIVQKINPMENVMNCINQFDHKKKVPIRINSIE